jgi:death-on-curing protein
MIQLDDVLNIHEFLINKFGGSHGIRDINLLQSALARPFQTFDQKELYSSHVDKAAALIESIVTNHPFIDGNKRTGYLIGKQNSILLSVTEEILFVNIHLHLPLW